MINEVSSSSSEIVPSPEQDFPILERRGGEIGGTWYPSAPSHVGEGKVYMTMADSYSDGEGNLLTTKNRVMVFIKDARQRVELIDLVIDGNHPFREMDTVEVNAKSIRMKKKGPMHNTKPGALRYLAD